MTFNITQGSTVEFTAEFLDVNGITTVPSSATLVMTYTTIANATASSAIGMTQVGSFFVATWPSGQAALGLANYAIAAFGQPTAASGTLRLLNRSS